MPSPREITDVAIDSALHRLPEPGNGWRSKIPPEDLGAMVDAGSGQITLQALVALLEYGNAKERAFAVRALDRYAEICWTRLMLSEPWSGIYGEAIVCCWVAAVILGERHGEDRIVRRFRALIRAWAATSGLMAARAADGKVHLLAAGCRCWGHEPKASSLTSLWRVAAGIVQPPAPGSAAYGTPGAYDDWGWLRRCARLGLSILRAESAAYVAPPSLAAALAAAPRWSARTEMQLLGWADGSRLWLMGDDEPGYDDEDPNGNTPGWLAAGVLGGRLVALPAWPNPVDGLTRLRQTACRADLDGDPWRGWTLWHSHLGERRGAHPATGAPGYLTHLPPYTAAPLAFHVLIPAGAGTWQVLTPGGAGDDPHDETQELPPTPTPEPPAAGTADFALSVRWVSSSSQWVLAAATNAELEVVKIWPGPGPDERQRWVMRIKRNA